MSEQKDFVIAAQTQYEMQQAALAVENVALLTNILIFNTCNQRDLEGALFLIHDVLHNASRVLLEGLGDPIYLE